MCFWFVYRRLIDKTILATFIYWVYIVSNSGSTLDYITDFFSKFLDGFFGWFNKELTIIFSEIPSEKVKTTINVGYQRFLIRQFQTSIFQEFFNQFFNFFSNFLSFCSNDEIISISTKVNFVFRCLFSIYFSILAFNMTFGYFEIFTNLNCTITP